MRKPVGTHSSEGWPVSTEQALHRLRAVRLKKAVRLGRAEPFHNLVRWTQGDSKLPCDAASPIRSA